MASRLRFFSILLLLVVLPSLSYAQFPWPVLFGAPKDNAITCVKVLDQEGASNRIVLGVTGSIYYSTDGGTTFDTAKTPTFPGIVTDFSFMDADTGWASIINNGTTKGLFVTKDGGATWAEVTTALAEGNDVYYHKGKGLLFMSSPSDSAAVSADFGVTWKNFAPIGMTGFAFSTPEIGVLAAASSLNAQPYYRTTDAGLTWQPTTMMQDGWQPVGVEGTTHFFVTDPVPTDKHMYYSRDGGLSWYTQTNFNSGGSFQPTGTVRGNSCALYASTSQGLYTSVDDGATWQLLATSPTSPVLTRFWATSSAVYVFTADTLYRVTPSLLPPVQPIHLTLNTIMFRSAGCDPVDTVIRLFSCACSNAQITGASVTPVSAGATPFSVLGANGRPFCGSDSVTIRYRPTSGLPDTADVHLRFMVGSTVVDTVIRVYGPGMPISVTPSAVNFYIHMKGCERVDTTLYLTNTLCNTLTLTQASLNDETHAVLNLPFSLPRTINPRETIALPITANAIAAGTYYATLTYQVTSPLGEVVTRTLGVTLLVSTTAHADIRGLNWTVPDLCSLHDSAIYYFNTLCDTVTINGITLGSMNDFKIPSLTFPIKIAPGEFLRIPLTIVPTDAGNYSTRLNIYGFIQDVPIDSAMTLSLKINKSLTPQATVTPNAAAFGVVSTCDSSKEKTLVFANTTCVPLTISSINFNVPGDSTYTFPYHFASGIVLQPGDKDSIRVHFWPKISGGSGSIKVTYTYKDQTKSVLYAVTGVGSDRVTASLSEPTIEILTMRYCDSAMLTTTLENGPCADIVISRITLLSGTGATVISPQQGDVIGAGEKKDVTIRFVPTTSGDVSGAIEIQISDKSGQTGVSDTIYFTGHVNPPVRSYTLGSIASDSLLACQTRDTTLTLANNGECDVITIGGVSSTNPKVTISNAAALTGMSLQVGQSAPVQVHVDPANVTADIVGNIVIQASPDITIPYNIPVKTCVNTPTIVTLSVPDSTFNTANCTTKTMQYAVSVNQNSTTVDVLQLENPATQFGNSLQIVGGGSLPAVVSPGSPLLFTVTYDPDAAGPNTVYLHVHSTDGKIDRRVLLTGVATGAPVQARLGLQTSAGGNTINTIASDQKITDLAVIMRDAVDPSVGLQSARFHVRYNKSVLTKTKITPRNGWTLSKDQGTEGDLDFTITYSGGAIPAGQQVATVSFLPALSTVTTTDVTIAQTHFNDTDPDFERCKLSLSSAGDAVTVNVGMTCGDSIIQRALLGQPIVADLSIVPNPSGVHAATTIHYKTFEDADVTVEVLNLSGRAVAESFGHMPVGDHSVVLPQNTLRSGTYLVRITAGAMQKVARFVVE